MMMTTTSFTTFTTKAHLESLPDHGEALELITRLVFTFCGLAQGSLERFASLNRQGAKRILNVYGVVTKRVAEPFAAEAAAPSEPSPTKYRLKALRRAASRLSFECSVRAVHLIDTPVCQATALFNLAAWCALERRYGEQRRHLVRAVQVLLSIVPATAICPPLHHSGGCLNALTMTTPSFCDLFPHRWRTASSQRPSTCTVSPMRGSYTRECSWVSY